ncbi:MAG: hypothetical protein KGK16_11310 [Bradyrhizobium sp.]|nr:hypothetical protein [Bradyrhizobium sp.]MBU6458832.1 hypothetical protein [Bradyrhizobium sp.]MDE2331353.1 hypothetical protein [Bradyrhizobium sp.]MDE2602159.1 hypothetical protein [Bradyrhizobium sp.]
MLIRGEKFGVQGGAAEAGACATSAASMPTLPLDGILGGLLLLIGP